MVKQTAGCGTWKSPVTAELVASGTIRLSSPSITDDGSCCWLEVRPDEGGRTVLVRRTLDGCQQDVTPPLYSVRTRVHEYGGGAYLMAGDTVYFSNFSDQRLYRQEPGKPPVPITPEAQLRYADGVFDQQRNRIICVCEDHSGGKHEPDNYLAAVELTGQSEPRKLVSGNDFYAAPRLNPDGTQLAWLTWNHPDMPWDGCELWLGDVNEQGDIVNHYLVAGSRQESICQPKFAPDGTLYFISDRTGWWNLYRLKGDAVECLWKIQAEFAEPDWVFGNYSYDFLSDGSLLCTCTEQGISRLAVINVETRETKPLNTKYTSISSITAGHGYALFLGGAPDEPSSVVQLNLFAGTTTIIRRSVDFQLDKGYVSVPEPLEFSTVNGLFSHAFYYAPLSGDYEAPAGELPPLLVFIHGGPTSATSSVFNPAIQYWTSRGFAVVDVNYGGSSGYGRAYRQRLDGAWGIVDVDDCVNAARYLVGRGLADGNRLAIRGGSAGGYTTLAALTFRDMFKAGASYYGVSDAEALAKDTHKFESRYLDRLIGPYPERRDIYLERSPVHHVGRLSCPVIFFQGSDDRVVPPDQSEIMVEALRRKGVPVAYLLFDGEQHGFRQAQNIKRALEAELYFYARVFGFSPPEGVEPVIIENL